MGGWPFNQQLKSFSGQSTWELGWELLRVCIVLPRKLTWVPPQKIGLFKKESHLPNLELLKFQPLGVFFWECFFYNFYTKNCNTQNNLNLHLIHRDPISSHQASCCQAQLDTLALAKDLGNFISMETCQAAGSGDRFLVIFC